MCIVLPFFYIDPNNPFADFTHRLSNTEDIEVVYYDVPVLQFNEITSTASALPENPKRSLRSDDPPDILSKVSFDPSVTVTETMLKELQSTLWKTTDAHGKPTAEYVTLPFLRCKDPTFLFNNTSPLLYIRSQYITLFDELMMESAKKLAAKRFILDGNSGVGKSCFIYYFMYRLHTMGISFRGYNCGRQSVTDRIPVVASDVSSLNVHDIVTWAILDSTERNSLTVSDCTFHLYVNSDQNKIIDTMENSLKPPEPEYAFYTLPPWSYADTCAVGLCPTLQPSCAADTSPTFSVIHPLSIMANYIAHRSAPRELIVMYKSLYYVFSAEQIDPLSHKLFLRAATAPPADSSSASPSDPLRQGPASTPYLCYESIFDQSVDYIVATRSVGQRLPHKGNSVITNSKAAAKSMVEDDIKSLIYLEGVECRCTAGVRLTDGIDPSIIKSAFRGIVQEMAMALKTNTDNAAFHTLFSALHTVIYVSVRSHMYSLINTLFNPQAYSNIRTVTLETRSTGAATNTDFSQHHTSGAFTFRQHSCIVGDTCNRQQMPLCVSTLKSVSDILYVFYYTLRSTTIMHIVSFMMAKADANLRQTVMGFFNSIFGPSGDGFCFEYFSLRNLVHEQLLDIYHLPYDGQFTQLSIPQPARLCYFHSVDHVTFHPNTIYIPFQCNYPGVDAIGSCTILGASYLVFYQCTTKDKHPLQFPTDTQPLETKSGKMVTAWKAKCNNIDCIVVFITTNSGFVNVEADYKKLNLDEQYVCFRKKSDRWC
jgi:hypothetical protein